MKKWFGLLFLSLFPILASAAEGSLSFAPPPGDYSVVFLGNLFGVVDGVLHGSGSQIMGVMFGVFNSAVLALGGMIIMYTLMVSTMNTAHEGQMLGQKWSSIWIPVRSTLGLALLIPKASGYCLMQIFIMWVVVQGVGAADKIWEAALSYLNRGGVIIQAERNPAIDLTVNNAFGVYDGALNILTGQVCMLGIQNQLEKRRTELLKLKGKDRGPCAGNNVSKEFASLCNTVVPDFIGTVNTVAVQNRTQSAEKFVAYMPTFDQSSPYASLNGICGQITWNKLDSVLDAFNPGVGTVGIGTGDDKIKLTSDELSTALMSRAIAIQQMYMAISTQITQLMVSNDPQLNNNETNPNAPNTAFAYFARSQFGVPYSANGDICNKFDENCAKWGMVSGTGTNKTILFSGTEFQGAVKDYNGVMQPTLKLIQDAKDAKNANASREFIQKANTQGWIMAGAYFFDLVKLNGNASASYLYDRDTGMEGGGSFDPSQLQFTDKCDVANRRVLCKWFEGDDTPLMQVVQLINGAVPNKTNSEKVAKPTFSMSENQNRKVVGDELSSTVYGFANNSMMVVGPGQPGMEPLKFAKLIKFSVDTAPYRMSEQEFDCGRVRIVVFSFCLGEMFGNLFYNIILLNVYNFFMEIFQQMINQVIMAFLMIPLQGMGDIFKLGVDQISKPGVNPIIALANMGTMYINFSANLWMMLLTLSVTTSLIPVFGVFIFALIGLALPLLIAWVGVMVSIGFTTAYFIPILPYMIFTFGSIAWLISVIEAMVAAPIVALGVTHPEGHDAFGKGEASIMILLNVFLRPAMMIIGYISAIALSYVGVWILNAGFDHAIGFIQGAPEGMHEQGEKVETAGGYKWTKNDDNARWDLGDTYGANDAILNSSANDDVTKHFKNSLGKEAELAGSKGSGSGNYQEWAGVYAYFFSILIYTSMYLVMVQRAFTLITYLPDKVLRWIGGSPESLGQEASQWGEEAKSGIKEAGGKTADAQGQMGKELGGYAQKGISGAKGSAQSSGGSVGAEGGGSEATPSGGDAAGGEAGGAAGAAGGGVPPIPP